MQPELKKFIEKQFLPEFKKNLLTLELDILWLEFMISEKEKALEEAKKPIILDPKKKPEKQIMEQASERAKLGDEIEALKKQKEEKEKVIELNQKFLEWLKEKIK
jgi:hypothetical protein